MRDEVRGSADKDSEAFWDSVLQGIRTDLEEARDVATLTTQLEATRLVTNEQVKAAAETLIAQHWDGTGCGTHGVNACSNCFGPSPMSAYEVARVVLDAARGVQS